MTRFSTLLLCAAATTAAAPLWAEDGKNREIIVTGQSLSQTSDALKSCIAKSCPADADIAAALAHAENQFVAGDYRDAKTTLKKAIGRNQKFRAEFPVEVSGLYRASSRVAEHLGEADEYRLRLLDMRDTLRASFPSDNAQVLSAQLEVADSRVRLGYPDNALAIYADVEKAALKAGHNQIATFAKLRSLLLIYAVGEEYASKSDKTLARKGLAEMVAQPLPGAEDYTLVAEIALARLDRKEGRADSTQAIMKRLIERGADRPLLLSTQPIAMPKSPYGERTTTGQQAPLNMGYSRIDGGSLPPPQNILSQVPRNFEDRWMDVGFWVTADGTVNDVEVLRTEGSGDWTRLVTDAIQTRQYAPLRDKKGAAHPGFYLVERYTYTARYMEEITGSRIARRSTQPRIERIDLTPENFDQPFSSSKKATTEGA